MEFVSIKAHVDKINSRKYYHIDLKSFNNHFMASWLSMGSISYCYKADVYCSSHHVQRNIPPIRTHVNIPKTKRLLLTIETLYHIDFESLKNHGLSTTNRSISGFETIHLYGIVQSLGTGALSQL